MNATNLFDYDNYINLNKTVVKKKKNNNTLKNAWKSVSKETNMDNLFENYNMNAFDTFEPDICMQCKSIMQVNDLQEYVCVNNTCGNISTKTLDNTPETSCVSNELGEPDQTRLGMPVHPYFPKSSMTCILSGNSGCADMYAIKKLFKYNGMEAREKAQQQDFIKIKNMATTANMLSIVVHTAIIIYRLLIDEGVFNYRKDNKTGLLIGCLYVACNKLGFPRTHKELSKLLNISESITGFGCSKVESLLNDIPDSVFNTNNLSINPSKWIERPCKQLNMSDELTKVCQFVAYKIEMMKLMHENTSSSIVGGILNLVSIHCNLPINKKQISEIILVSSVTIHKCTLKLTEHIDSLIPAVILEKYKKIK